MEGLSEEEKKALRGSKFAPLPPPPASSSSSRSQQQPRLAHPGGPLKTNKAAALAKFLERKLHEDPNGLASIDPQLLELAVQNAKNALLSSSSSSGGTSNSGRIVRHVDSFGDNEESFEEEKVENSSEKKNKRKKKKKQKGKKNKNQKIHVGDHVKLKKPKKFKF